MRNIDYNKLHDEAYANAKALVFRKPLQYRMWPVQDEGTPNSFTLVDNTNTESHNISLRVEGCGEKLESALGRLHVEALLGSSASKWDNRFLMMAKHVSSFSKDPSTKVGAVVVDDDYNVRTIGYNGFPRGVKDTPERLNDRSQKYPLVVHAELNAICTCARVGVPTKGSTMVCTHFPCADCAGAIVQAGFTKVVVLASTEDFSSRWEETNKFAFIIFTEGGVDVTVLTEKDISNGT